MNADQIIAEVSILQTLTPVHIDNDAAWLAVARNRLAELRSGA